MVAIAAKRSPETAWFSLHSPLTLALSHWGEVQIIRSLLITSFLLCFCVVLFEEIRISQSSS